MGILTIQATALRYREQWNVMTTKSGDIVEWDYQLERISSGVHGLQIRAIGAGKKHSLPLLINC